MARDDISTITRTEGRRGVRTCIPSTYELADGEPDEFKQERAKTYVLSYALDSNGAPVFSCETETESESSLWGKIIDLFQHKDPLDIKVKKKDTLVTVETDSRVGLFFSTARSAVMTRNDHKDFYGELRYWDGTNWKRRTELASGVLCRKIQFKAKLRGGIFTAGHAFSYNVRYDAGGGTLTEYEIDPDIKNPSM